VLLHPQYDLGKSEYFTSSFLKLAAMWGWFPESNSPFLPWFRHMVTVRSL
jgi:hypothetical protein